MSANAIADAKIIQNGGNLNDYTNGIKNSKSSGSLEGQMQDEDVHDGMYVYININLFEYRYVCLCLCTSFYIYCIFTYRC
jgi:hypothetical protein